MKGRRYVVSGDPKKMLNTVYRVLERQHGYTLKYLDDGSTMAEKGSAGAEWAGVFFSLHRAIEGSENYRRKLHITSEATPRGLQITLAEKFRGMGYYKELYSDISQALENTGNLRMDISLDHL